MRGTRIGGELDMLSWESFPHGPAIAQSNETDGDLSPPHVMMILPNGVAVNTEMTEKPKMRHKLKAGRFIEDRRAWILDKARGCRVVHLGCTDAGFLEDKINQDMQLHAQLANACSKLIGIDIDRSGIEQLNARGYEDILCADIARDHAQIIEEVAIRMGACDLIICGEVLEHVLNQGSFLEGVRQLAIANQATVIISVPNAFSLEGFVSVGLGVEDVHPDHKCYFSQVTLNTLLRQTGFRTVETCFYSRDRAKSRLRRILKRAIAMTVFAIRPQLADGLIVVAKPDEMPA